MPGQHNETLHMKKRKLVTNNNYLKYFSARYSGSSPITPASQPDSQKDAQQSIKDKYK